MCILKELEYYRASLHEKGLLEALKKGTVDNFVF